MFQPPVMSAFPRRADTLHRRRHRPAAVCRNASPAQHVVDKPNFSGLTSPRSHTWNRRRRKAGISRRGNAERIVIGRRHQRVIRHREVAEPRPEKYPTSIETFERSSWLDGRRRRPRILPVPISQSHVVGKPPVRPDRPNADCRWLRTRRSPARLIRSQSGRSAVNIVPLGSCSARSRSPG